MDGLFPKMPKALDGLSDKEVEDLLAEHEAAVGLIKGNDPEFLEGRSPEEIISEFEAGRDQILTLRGELTARAEAEENYVNRLAEIDESLVETKSESTEDEGDEGDADGEGDEPSAEAEPEPDAEDGDEAEAVEEKVLVTASADTSDEPVVEKPRLARPPAPAEDRVVVNEPDTKQLAFVASGLLPVTPPGKELETSADIAAAIIEKARSLGAPTHSEGGREERFQVAHLDYSAKFDEDHTLRSGDLHGNGRKLEAVGTPFGSPEQRAALTASGGLCAPAENIYSMPQLATQARPVRDGLPSFRAERGAINVPVPTTVGDAFGAITVISEAEDALGGTFATKSCLDLTCPSFNETAVTVISHCREFGNLNAMSWPEKIAHENEITMAEHARISEGYLLGRIKHQSINVTNGLETLGAMIYLVDAIVKARFGIVSRLRMDPETVFDAYLPAVLPDLLQLDTVQTQFGRFASEEELVGYLRGLDINPIFYIDTALTADGTGNDGVSQIADASQATGALEGLPDQIEWAIHPRGTFLHIDMAELNLGIVRDSVLNSTNDFQNFGETFENVALIGPPQAAYWVISDLCASGQFPPVGTARTCD